MIGRCFFLGQCQFVQLVTCLVPLLFLTACSEATKTRLFVSHISGYSFPISQRYCIYAQGSALEKKLDQALKQGQEKSYIATFRECDDTRIRPTIFTLTIDDYLPGVYSKNSTPTKEKLLSDQFSGASYVANEQANPGTMYAARDGNAVYNMTLWGNRKEDWHPIYSAMFFMDQNTVLLGLSDYSAWPEEEQERLNIFNEAQSVMSKFVETTLRVNGLAVD